jgi:hypothetical protein
MTNILDPKFQYTPSYATNIRKTFERVRAAQQAAKEPTPFNVDLWAKRVMRMVREGK